MKKVMFENTQLEILFQEDYTGQFIPRKTEVITWGNFDYRVMQVLHNFDKKQINVTLHPLGVTPEV